MTNRIKIIWPYHPAAALLKHQHSQAKPNLVILNDSEESSAQIQAIEEDPSLHSG